jgi:hypothetical protein
MALRQPEIFHPQPMVSHFLVDGPLGHLPAARGD